MKHGSRTADLDADVEAEAYVSAARAEADGRNLSGAGPGAEAGTATGGKRNRKHHGLLEAAVNAATCSGPTSGWWKTKERRESMDFRSGVETMACGALGKDETGPVDG